VTGRQWVAELVVFERGIELSGEFESIIILINGNSQACGRHSSAPGFIGKVRWVETTPNSAPRLADYRRLATHVATLSTPPKCDDVRDHDCLF
jgi:hypothetical protein